MSAPGEAREEERVGFFGREGVEEDEGPFAADVTCSCGEGGRKGSRVRSGSVQKREDLISIVCTRSGA